MRSRTLASAIALGCATWAPSLAMFVPGAVAAQVTSDTPSSNPSALAPTPTRRLTLTEALSLAETANPALRTKLAQLDAAQGVRTEASALLYNNPELSTELTRRTVPQSGQGDERRREWNVGVAQTLEIAGQQGHRREAAESALAALQSEIDDARLTARSAAAIAFYRALAAQERVVLEAQALKLFESTSAAIQKRRSAGEDTKLDANIAAVEAERARNQLAIAQEQLLSARSELSTATQLPPETLPEAIGELTMTPKAFLLADLMAAVDSQPRMRALAQRENSAASKLKLEQASTYPDITVGVNVGREGASAARERLTTVTLSVPLPLFRRNDAGIGQARSELSQTRQERQTTTRDAHASVNALWLRMNSLEARVRRLQESMLPALADNQQLSIKSQQAGQIGLLELIVVNRQSLDARRDLIDALAEYHTTRLELELAAGWSLGGTQP